MLRQHRPQAWGRGPACGKRCRAQALQTQDLAKGTGPTRGCLEGQALCSHAILWTRRPPPHQTKRISTGVEKGADSLQRAQGSPVSREGPVLSVLTPLLVTTES